MGARICGAYRALYGVLQLYDNATELLPYVALPYVVLYVGGTEYAMGRCVMPYVATRCHTLPYVALPYVALGSARLPYMYGEAMGHKPQTGHFPHKQKGSFFISLYALLYFI
jgi:hypothetical protein